MVSALIGASIRLSFRGVGVCRWRVAEDGRRWPAVIRSDTRISLIYCARRCVFFPNNFESLTLSLSPFSNFLFSPLSPLSLLPLVYEVGNELWQLAARKNTATAIHANLSHVRREKEVFTGCDRVGPRSNRDRASILDVQTTTNWTILFPFFFFFFSFSSFFKVIEFPFFPFPSQTQLRVVC